MKRIALTFCLSLAGTSLVLSLPACQTDQPGVKSSYRSQWATVSADTERTTEAAKTVFENLDLQNVESASTSLDGQVIGYTADGTQVTASVERLNDTTSNISINVGTFGDPDRGSQILAEIREQIEGE